MSPKLYIQLFILTLSLITISCATPDVDEGEINKLRPEVNENTNINTNPNANVAEDNEVELNSLINLPFDPKENVYREDIPTEAVNNNQVSKPNERELIAVLKFSKDDTENLTEQLKVKSEPFEAKVDPEPWFPAELIAKSQTSGDESIKGIGYNADLFFKEPFNKGTLTHVNDTDYFVLILQTQ